MIFCWRVQSLERLSIELFEKLLSLGALFRIAAFCCFIGQRLVGGTTD